MPLSAAGTRLASLDVVRGVAVLGILLLNILSFAMPEAAYVNPRAYGGWHGADLATWAINFVLFDGRMRGLFSFLFGASTLLVVERAEAGGRGPAGVHYRRMAWLLVFGVAHLFLVWHGDILAHYAMMGMIAYAMRRLPVPRLLVLGAMLALAGAILFATIPLGIVQLQAQTPNAPALHGYAQAFGVPSPADIAKDLALHRGSYGAILADRLREDGGALFALFVFFGPETLGYMLFGMAALRSGMLRGEWPRARYRRLRHARSRGDAAAHRAGPPADDRRMDLPDPASRPPGRRADRPPRRGGAHGLHQLSRHQPDLHHALLRLWPGLVRAACALAALPDCLRHLGTDPALVQGLARPFPIRPVRVVVAQPGALASPADPQRGAG